MSTGTSPGQPHSVVLVHGLWSGPHDWRWVQPLLERAGARVVAVDLPSHRSADHGIREDGEAVRTEIRTCEPPVVVAAWSAGADSMNLGAEGEAGVARLVYVASYPSRPHGELPEPTERLEDDPLIRRVGDGSFVLDTDRWLEAEAHLFDPAVLEHLRQHRRRPVSLRALTDPNPGAAWTTIPFTVLLGRRDPLIPVDQAVQDITDLTTDMLRTRPDIRIIDSDHFIPLRNPDVVADLILEPLPFSR